MTSWGSLVAAVGRANLSQNEALERRRSAQKNQQSDQVQGPQNSPAEATFRRVASL